MGNSRPSLAGHDREGESGRATGMETNKQRHRCGEGIDDDRPVLERLRPGTLARVTGALAVNQRAGDPPPRGPYGATGARRVAHPESPVASPPTCTADAGRRGEDRGGTRP